jgi:UDP-glucose 4-epimerase
VHRLHDFLVVCFCCDCCCMVRTDMKQAGPGFRDTIKKLDAVRVEVTDRCEGCGTCAETCFMGAIAVEDGRARIDPEQCKSCGRCSMVCPQQAIQVDFDHEDALWQELLTRVQPAIKSPRKK